jgi:hypothetical protein
MREPGWPHGNRSVARTVWELWKPGHIMSCEINAHPLGYQLRLYMRGEFLSSQVFETLEQTEADAEAQKQEALARGWAARPPMPE